MRLAITFSCKNSKPSDFKNFFNISTAPVFIFLILAYFDESNRIPLPVRFYPLNFKLKFAGLFIGYQKSPVLNIFR